MPMMLRLVLIFMALTADPIGAQPPQKPTKVALKTLDAAPDKYLGKRIEIDATLPAIAFADAAKTELSLKIDGNVKPFNLRFLVSTKLANLLQNKVYGESSERMVQVTGTVVAPSRPNAPYGIDVEEIRLIGADNRLLASLKADELPPVTTNPKAELTPAKVSPEPVEKDAPAEGVPPSVFAAGLALAVGIIVGSVLLLKRRRKAAAPLPPPTTSVSDRLNRRVR